MCRKKEMLLMFGNPLAKIEKLAQKGKSEKLAAFTRHKNKDVRLAAIRALGSCNDETAYNTLTGMIVDAETDERIAALEGLGRLGKDQSFSLISHYVNNEPDPRVKKAMQDAMTAIRTHEQHKV